jgi:hypothetical protein
MAKESTLKKEFVQRDVSRIRNLIQKKYDDPTRIQSGFEASKAVREEGEVWEEGGKKWTIKNGIKQSINRLKKVKELTNLPYLCPECNTFMVTSELNKKMYTLHRKCFDCVVEFENNLKAQGLYSDYEKALLNSNKNDDLKDLEKALEDWLAEVDTAVTEQGDVEDWVGGGVDFKKKIYQEVKEVLDKAINTEI